MTPSRPPAPHPAEPGEPLGRARAAALLVALALAAAGGVLLGLSCWGSATWRWAAAVLAPVGLQLLAAGAVVMGATAGWLVSRARHGMVAAGCLAALGAAVAALASLGPGGLYPLHGLPLRELAPVGAVGSALAAVALPAMVVVGVLASLQEAIRAGGGPPWRGTGLLVVGLLSGSCAALLLVPVPVEAYGWRAAAILGACCWTLVPFLAVPCGIEWPGRARHPGPRRAATLASGACGLALGLGGALVALFARVLLGEGVPPVVLAMQSGGAVLLAATLGVALACWSSPRFPVGLRGGVVLACAGAGLLLGAALTMAPFAPAEGETGANVWRVVVMLLPGAVLLAHGLGALLRRVRAGEWSLGLAAGVAGLVLGAVVLPPQAPPLAKVAPPGGDLRSVVGAVTSRPAVLFVGIEPSHWGSVGAKPLLPAGTREILRAGPSLESDVVIDLAWWDDAPGRALLQVERLQLLRERLGPGGTLIVRLQLDEHDRASLQRVLATFRAEFVEGSVWMDPIAAPGEVLLVGRAGGIDLTALPPGLAALQVLDGWGLRMASAGRPPATVLHPRLDFAPSLPDDVRGEELALWLLAHATTPRGPADPAWQAEVARLAAVGQHVALGRAAQSGGDWTEAARQYLAAKSLAPEIEEVARLVDLPGLVAPLGRALADMPPAGSVAWGVGAQDAAGLLEAYGVQGRGREALALASSFLATLPDLPEDADPDARAAAARLARAAAAAFETAAQPARADELHAIADQLDGRP